MVKGVTIGFVYVLTLLNAAAIFGAQMVLSLYALNRGAGAFAVGVIAASFAIFPTVIGVPLGRLVDRYGGRWPMTIGSLVGAVGLALPWLAPGMPVLYVAGLFAGFSLVCVNLSSQNLVGQLSTADTRARYFSNYTLTVSAASFLGPLAGGFAIDTIGHGYACLMLAAAAAGPLVMMLARGRHMPGGTHRPAAEPGKEGGGSVRELLADPVIRRILVTGMMINAGINMFQVYMPVYAHDAGISASTTGLVLGMYSVAAFLSRIVLPDLVRRLGEQRLIAVSFAAGAVGLALVPTTQAALVLGAIAFGFGLGMGSGQPLVMMMMYNQSKDGRSGEALGLKFTTNQFTKLAGPVTFGAVASLIGLAGMFWINALMLAAGGAMNRPRRS